MRQSTPIWILLATLALLLPAAPAPAADHLFAIYGWLSGVDGDVTVRRVSSEIDQSFSDLADNLEGAVLLHWEARQERWTVLADIVAISLGQQSQGGRLAVDLDQSIVEVLAGYRISPGFDLLFGGRYLSFEPRLTGPIIGRVERAKDWVDPVVGGRFLVPLSDQWQLIARGDLGGFGVGSELTWNVAANVLYRASRSVSVAFGYRALGVDFDEGEGRDRFAYDVVTSGPQVGVAFHF